MQDILPCGSQPRTTVAICTHNRCLTLAETLTALLAQEPADLRFDVLVIDNASTDATKAVVQSFQGQSIPIRYSYEPNLGLSYARNRVLDEINTTILAFLDDDTIPEPGWLSALLAVYDTVRPIPSAVGGKILLRWDKDLRPEWMPDQLLGLYSHIDYGVETIPVRRLNGCNISFLTNVARQYRYDVRLGVKSPDQVTGEDTDILFRLHLDGHTIYYSGQAVVQHVVGALRQNKAYLLRRSRGNGQARFIMLLAQQHSKWLSRRTTLWWMLREICYQRLWLQQLLIACVIGRIFRDERQRLYLACKIMHLFAFERAAFGALVSGTSHNQAPPPKTSQLRTDLKG